MNRVIRWMLCGLVVTAGAGAPNLALASGVGPRIGAGWDPDQFVVGVQAVLGKKIAIAHVAPSLDFGFGDKVNTYVFNLDAIIPIGSGAGFYAGGGVGLALWDFPVGSNDGEIGLNAIGGLRFPFGARNLYNIEARFGISDVPDFRLLIGVLLGGRAAPRTAAR